MLAKEVMTSPVITISPNTEVQAIAKLFLERQISAVPVIGRHDRLLGIVGEGDLLRRVETDTGRHRSWWLALLAHAEFDARECIKARGQRAVDVMTPDVTAVSDEASLQDVAHILEERQIKRVPVMRGGRLVGIVSRANLLHGLAAGPPLRPSSAKATDQAIRTAILNALRDDAGITTDLVNVVVSRGVVDLWGVTESKQIKRAIQLVAHNVQGVCKVRDHTGVMPPMVRSAVGVE